MDNKTIARELIALASKLAGPTQEPEAVIFPLTDINKAKTWVRRKLKQGFHVWFDTKAKGYALLATTTKSKQVARAALKDEPGFTRTLLELKMIPSGNGSSRPDLAPLEWHRGYFW